MKYKTNWKLFSVLLIASVIAGLLVMPYVLALTPSVAKLFTPAVIAAQVAQFLILFSIAIYFGLRLASRVGFGLPVLEGRLKGERQSINFKLFFGKAVGWGVLAGALIILLSLLWPSLSVSMLKTEAAIPAWKLLLVPLYGGIAEEILMRLLIMTLLVWITFKIKKTADNQPTKTGVWLAIVLTAVIFGLGHLPVTSNLAAITTTVIFRAILLNGVAGVIFGWLYYKKGLESAIIAHFSADVVLHILTPLVARYVIGLS